MTVRNATFSDIPALADLLKHGHERSVYRDLCSVDDKEAKAFLMSAIQRHDSPNEGGTWVQVAETSGDVVGVMIGVLDRIYVVGSKLRAIDVFYYGADRAAARDMIQLFDAFVAWGEANPKVAMITPTATHVVGDYSKAEKLFARRGFEQSGVIYERRIGL